MKESNRILKKISTNWGTFICFSIKNSISIPTKPLQPCATSTFHTWCLDEFLAQLNVFQRWDIQQSFFTDTCRRTRVHCEYNTNSTAPPTIDVSIFWSHLRIVWSDFWMVDLWVIHSHLKFESNHKPSVAAMLFCSLDIDILGLTT